MTQSGEDFRHIDKISAMDDLELMDTFFSSLKPEQREIAPGFLAFLESVEKARKDQIVEASTDDLEIDPWADEFAKFYESLELKQKAIFEEMDSRRMLVASGNEHEN